VCLEIVLCGLRERIPVGTLLCKKAGREEKGETNKNRFIQEAVHERGIADGCEKS
jgi:hypothetical protein